MMKRIFSLALLLAIILSGCEDFWGERVEEIPDTAEETPNYWTTDIDNEIIKMEFLGYTDYYDGGNSAVGYDITNKTNKIISHIRTKTYTLNRYPDSFPNWQYTCTVYETIPPGTNRYDVYFMVGGITCYYQQHALEEVHVWYHDETDYLWTNPAAMQSIPTTDQ